MVALAVVLVLLVVGSLIFHFASPWYFTPLASNWSTIDFTVDVTFWVTGVVFVIVNLFTAYCVWRFRAKKGNKAHYEPESSKLEIALTVFTALGDSVNVAARLQDMTKSLNCKAVISEEVCKTAEIPDDALTRTQVAIRGHDESMTVRTAEDPTVLASLLDPVTDIAEAEPQGS